MIYSLRNIAVVVSIALSHALQGQTVGVVLSGGGATAMCHIGFLKSLEENEIPIDYICGTSMGAVIASLYAAGYTIQEMEDLVSSREFLLMATGIKNDEVPYMFNSAEPRSDIAKLKISANERITASLPTNLVDPALLDWNLASYFARADSISGNDFDHLMIPLRCVAADIQAKELVVFRNGPLATAARVSCTYPFYMPPKNINGHLLYDGGIFNNFPVDVMYEEFIPDIIIGCNVSGQIEAPKEDDVLSQIQAMITYRKEIESPCENTIVVRPQLDEIGTFDFDRAEEAIAAGYRAAQAVKDVFRKEISRKNVGIEVALRRQKLRARSNEIIIDDIEINGLSKTQMRYVQRVMGIGKGAKTLADLKQPYFRVFGDEKIKSVYPIVKFDSLTGKKTLQLDARRNRSFQLEFGGNFASRSINSGYLGLRYHLFGLTSAFLEANTYFGRYYGSLHSALRWDFPGKVPFAVKASFTYNRWDFYRSLTTFFDDVKPSFVLLNERFGSVQISTPSGNHAVLKAELIYTHQFDQYYQKTNFLSTDTADRTEFDAWIPKISYEYNTLNRKQFASKGSQLLLSGKFVQGVEYSIPGTTSEVRDTVQKLHSWINIRAKYKSYINRSGRLRCGYHLEGVWSDQDIFINYIGTVTNLPAFQPTIESPTYFLPQFRSTNYAAGGLLLVGLLSDDLELRGEGYVLNSFVNYNIGDLALPMPDYRWRPLYTGSISLVYHSIIGPFSLGAYYHEKKEKPWSFLFNYGYILFNASPRE